MLYMPERKDYMCRNKKEVFASPQITAPSTARRSTFAVVFDMDGVIVDNMQYHKKAWEMFLQKYAPEIELLEFTRHFGKTNKDLLKIIFKQDISSADEIRLGEEKEALYRKLYAQDIAPVNGLSDFLRILKKNQVKTAVATASPEANVDFVFKNVELRKYFDAVIDASDAKKGKPDPEIYLKAAHEIACPPASCLVFEDSFPGIQSAINAGMKVIGVTTSHPPEILKKTEFNINDFTEISFAKIKSLFL